jgi:predicted DNA-binding transcriptional regulator AlpA
MSNTASPDAFIRQSRLLESLPFSAATLWRNVKNGTFPRPVKLSERVTAWRVRDVAEWTQAQAGRT